MQAVRLVIVGAGGHAAVVADIARLVGSHVVGFLDSAHPERAGSPYCDSEVLGGLEQCAPLRAAQVSHAVVAIGDCHVRMAIGQVLEAEGFTLLTLRHPAAVIAADVKVGAGSVIAAGAVVNPGTQIGRHVILNTACSVDHHCVIEDAVHVCPGVRLAGGVNIGREAWVGIGSTVINGISIGSRSLVGAGAVVVHDVPPGVVVTGVPARVVRAR